MSDLVELIRPTVKELTSEYRFDDYDLLQLLAERFSLQEVERRLVISQGRWATRFRSVYGDNANNFVAINWSEGSTEMQEDTEPNVLIQRVVAEPSVRYVVPQ